MAKQKPRKPPRKTDESKWVRNGGAVGDPTMEEMNEFIMNGCGVNEDEQDVGSMPNESVMRPENRSRLV